MRQAGTPIAGALGSGLIFDLIRLRSPTFISIQFDAAMQVADVNGIRRTVIPTPENRKVGSSFDATLVAKLLVEPI
jgi:hypothetical protein